MEFNQQLFRYYIELHRPRGSRDGFAGFLRELRLLSSASLIVGTHGTVKPSRRHVVLQLWHGLPLKGMAFTERTDSVRQAEDLWRYVDYATSYSMIYTMAMSASMLTHPGKFITTGMPRNDLLFASGSRDRLARIFPETLEARRIVVFMPTFREGYGRPQGGKNYDNPFGFVAFNAANFDRCLGKLGCKLVVKPHPHDEAHVLAYLRKQHMEHLLLLSDADLQKHGFDIYELLGAADALLTDYSSVYFDFLLLDRPILFCPVDLEAYRRDRGFVLEPYESWTPGPKALNQAEMEESLRRSLNEVGWFAAERQLVRSMLHHYMDDGASRRTWKVIDTLMAGKDPVRALAEK
jgi:CDP-ribitol ribitolphosphotransferase